MLSGCKTYTGIQFYQIASETDVITIVVSYESSWYQLAWQFINYVSFQLS